MNLFQIIFPSFLFGVIVGGLIQFYVDSSYIKTLIKTIKEKDQKL